jgi:glycosyltransferase involved in cell wall biosynthesis
MEISSNTGSRSNLHPERLFGWSKKAKGGKDTKKLRVCMLVDSWKPVYGGAQVHVWELSTRLVENHNCTVDIYTRKLTGDSQKKYDKNESHMDGKLNIFRTGFPIQEKNPVGKIVYVLNLPFKVKADYDIIHAHSYSSVWAAEIIKNILRKPLVYTIHGIDLKVLSETGKDYSTRIRLFMENLTLFHFKYDCEISVDHSINDYGNINKNVEVIPNGVDTSKFDIVETKKSDKFRILFVGKFTEQKGLTYLVEAAKDVLKKNPSAEFHLIGAGPMESEIRTEIENSGLADNFKLMGEIYGEDLILEYKAADMFVLPSIYEGQPLTILEAWAAKLPVVVTNVGGNKEFIRNGVNGYLVEAKNPGKLSEAIIKLMENPSRSTMGEAGYNLVKEHYSWDRMAEKTYNVYNKLVRKS